MIMSSAMSCLVSVSVSVSVKLSVSMSMSASVSHFSGQVGFMCCCIAGVVLPVGAGPDAGAFARPFLCVAMVLLLSGVNDT